MGAGWVKRLILLWSAYSSLLSVLATPDEGDLTSLIEGVFGEPPKHETSSSINPPLTEPRNDAEGEEDCECVPYYLCNNGSINTDGTGIIDIRRRDCENYIDECCKTPVTTPITPPPKLRKGCGFRNEDGIGFRITGAFDNEAQFGEFPWMIAILKGEKVEDGTELNVYQCGGSLIHPKVVLTAAHCVANKNVQELKARGGEWDTQTLNELYPYQDRQVFETVVHEKYYAGALYNDIALLILDKPFEAASNLDIVCLPRQGDVILENDCYASGWGKDLFGKEGKYQVILKRVNLPMVQRDVCQEALRKTRLGHRFKLHESFVCAGGEKGKDTCKGDGGSPLVCPIRYGEKSQYQQVGIVAWGIGCGDENPAVYVNVAHFVQWIEKQIARFNLKPEFYY